MPANRTSRISLDLSRYVTASVAASVAASLRPVQVEVRSIAAQLAADDAAAMDRLLASAVQASKIAPAETVVWASRFDVSPGVTAEVLAERSPGYAGPVLTQDDIDADEIYEAMFGKVAPPRHSGADSMSISDPGSATSHGSGGRYASTGGGVAAVQ